MMDQQLKFLLLWKDACQPHIDFFVDALRNYDEERAVELWDARASSIINSNLPLEVDNPKVAFERQLAACSLLYVDLLIMFGCFNDE